MNSSKYKNRQLQYLASLLRCAPGEIDYLCNNIGKYYTKWVEEKKDKVTGELKTYPDGTPKIRVIRPSWTRLKAIQRSIHRNILAKVPLPEMIQGGVKGKSNITNARQHQGNKYQFLTDLKDFFPSITPDRIYNLFLDLGYSSFVASWLTKLTSLEFQLPQGTPTSTAIANLVFLSTDQHLLVICAANNITYTRFVDDLSFSSPIDFRHLTPLLLDIVRADGFQISYRKTAYGGNQTITGIVVLNNYLDAPDDIKQKAAEELSRMDNNGPMPYSLYMQRIAAAKQKK